MTMARHTLIDHRCPMVRTAIAAIMLVLGVLGSVAAAENHTLRLRNIDASGFPTVTCAVTVTDGAGVAVSGLTGQDFFVNESDSPAGALQCQQRRDEKLAVALIIDCSGSMKGKAMTAAANAAVSFVRRMGEADTCSVISCGSSGSGAAGFSVDKDLAVQKIRALRAGGWTAFHDAVFDGVQQLKSQPADRKVVVALSDGKDNRSVHTLAQVITSADSNGVEIYTVGLGHADPAPLRRLAAETGGLSLRSATAADLLTCYRSIFGAITTTYQLSYSSPNAASEPILRTLSIAYTGGAGTARAEMTYNVPSGYSAGGGGEAEGDLLTMLIMVAAGANALLLGGVLIKRGRSAARRGKQMGGRS